MTPWRRRDVHQSAALNHPAVDGTRPTHTHSLAHTAAAMTRSDGDNHHSLARPTFASRTPNENSILSLYARVHCGAHFVIATQKPLFPERIFFRNLFFSYYYYYCSVISLIRRSCTGGTRFDVFFNSPKQDSCYTRNLVFRVFIVFRPVRYGFRFENRRYLRRN